jgi:hypothetical protein
LILGATRAVTRRLQRPSDKNLMMTTKKNSIAMSMRAVSI